MPFFDFKGPQDDQSSEKAAPATPPIKARGSEADEFGGDIGFSRYFFPGAAHNDYWRDPDVFGHFLQTVVDPTRQILPPASQKTFSTPGTIRFAWVTSYALPYLLSAGLLFVGVYVMYKALRACLDPVGAPLESSGEIVRNVNMGRKSRFESKALQHVYDRYVGKDPEKTAAFEEELANAEVARKIYDLRTKAGLTQDKLAKLVGTTASVISRLEDADYDGHSLAMLRRIAKALNKRVEIRFISL